MRSVKSGAGYFMVLPYVVYFLTFVAYPLVFSFILIFHRWNVATPMEFIGFKNFVRLFNDELFFKSLFNTLVFLSIHIPLQIFIALFFAQLLNQKIKMKGFFRALYFLPVVVSGVVVTILWQQMYAYETGLINQVLVKARLKRIPWLVSPELAMPSIAVMATWKNVGFYIVIFLAGLQNIPQELYEAAEIDGAPVLKSQKPSTRRDKRKQKHQLSR